MANDVRLYGLIIALKNRIEINADKGHEYSKAQLNEAVRLINEINACLDRRVKR